MRNGGVPEEAAYTEDPGAAAAVGTTTTAAAAFLPRLIGIERGDRSVRARSSAPVTTPPSMMGPGLPALGDVALWEPSPAELAGC